MAGLVSVASRIWLAASLADTGDFAEALARAREGVALAESPEHPWSLAGAYMTLGFVHLSQGHLDEAGPVLDRGIAFSREMDLTAWLPMLLCARGVAHARSGRVVDGLLLLEEGVRRASALRILSRHALRLAWLAEGYLLAGRVDRGSRRGRSGAAARGRARRAGVRGDGAAHAGRDRGAGRAGDARGGALRRRAGAGPRARDAPAGGALPPRAGRAGAPDGRRRARRRSGSPRRWALLRELDMRYWLAQAEAALREA